MNNDQEFLGLENATYTSPAATATASQTAKTPSELIDEIMQAMAKLPPPPIEKPMAILESDIKHLVREDVQGAPQFGGIRLYRFGRFLLNRAACERLGIPPFDGRTFL